MHEERDPMTTITLPRATVEQALEALKYLHEEKCNYMRRNNLGDPLRENAARLALPAITTLRAALVQEQAEPLTIERLRDALVASRIIPPAAVEDPDEYDDGVTLHRIEALHRRLT